MTSWAQRFAILPALLVIGGCQIDALSGKPAVVSAEKVAAIRAEEVGTAARFSVEGKVLYEADSNKKSGFDYCSTCVRFANRGDFREAVRAATKALFLGERSGDDYLLAFANRDIALTYSLAGHLDRAEEFATRALEHVNRASNVANYKKARALIHKIRGDVYAQQGRIEESVADYQAAIIEGEPKVRWLAKVALANAYMADGLIGEAKSLFNEAGQSPDAEITPLIERAIAEIALLEGNHQEAANLFRQAADKHADAADAYHAIWALDGLARAHAARGDRESAIAAYMRGITAAESVRAEFRSEEFKAGFFGNIQHVFDRAVDLLMAAGRTEDALWVSERSRARALLDLVRDRAAPPAAGKGVADAMGHVLRASEIRAALPDDVALVIYHVLADRTYAWLVRRSGIESVGIDVDRDRLVDLAIDYRLELADRVLQSSRSGADLHRLLIDPLELKVSEAVVFVPHNALHYLPFHALPGPGGYLVEARAVTYAPSASALVHILRREEPGRAAILAMGNPDLGIPSLDLPGASTEIRSIKSLYPQTELYERSEATKARLMAKAPQSNVLHIAAHAEVDDLDPLYSTIHLARTSAGPGDLEAREIYGLDLSATRLVALSACDTGRGKVTRGDEIWGFTRTFLSAGTRSLLVSHWPVSDKSTARLMERFYADWRDKPAGTALRNAQLALLSDEKTSHPFYWAPFTLVGDWR